jgi:hypothetical protein
MVSHLFFYQLALIALVWLFLVLHYTYCMSRRNLIMVNPRVVSL